MNAPTLIDERLLRGWPLPRPDHDGDKEARGRTLVVAGSREVPGAALLAGTAALRAGAGKLMIATVASVAPQLAVAMPEARVVALPETASGGPMSTGVEPLQALAERLDAVLIGPGLPDETSGRRFVRDLLPAFASKPVILDASAMAVVDSLRRLSQPILLTPHAGELAGLSGEDKQAILDDAPGAALRAAQRWNAIVALKGARTVIATPEGRAWDHVDGNPGLATSGSGDVLAGLIVGLAARGASLEQAAVWGVALHARAGRVLAQRVGALGYLARELAAEVPALMQALGQSDLPSMRAT